jgi:pyroglutamyl-peptidase
MKLLMTGFEPFCGERINPSEELLKLFFGDSRIKTLLLPVSYQRSVEVIEAELESVGKSGHDLFKNRNASSDRNSGWVDSSDSGYDFILLCGQAGGRKHICLERVAINCIDADKADEDGKLFLEKEISVAGPPAYLSPLPLRQWTTDLRARGFNVEISNSAGAFVCNHIYYRIQQLLHDRDIRDVTTAGSTTTSSPSAATSGGTARAKTEVLFLHVPYLTEQLMGKPADTFGMSLEAMKQTVDALLTMIEVYLQNR